MTTGIVLAALLGGMAIGRGYLSRLLNSSFGEEVARATQGLIRSPEAFFGWIIDDVVVLVAVIILVSLVSIGIYFKFARAENRFRTLVIGFVIAVTAINIVLVTASHTILFWATLHAAHPNLKQSAFHLNRLILKYADVDTKVAIIGSSQGQSQLHAGEFNDSLPTNFQVSNFSYAGAGAVDFPQQLASAADSGADVVICYLSEINVNLKVTGARFLPLSDVTALPWLLEVREHFPDVSEPIGHAMFGWAVPVFKYRRAFEMAVFGEFGEFGVRLPVISKGSGRNAQDSERSVADRIARAVKDYDFNDHERFQWAALREFFAQAQSEGIGIVVLKGQINPVVYGHLPPDVRKNLARNLEQASAEYDNVELWADLGFHRAADYDDLSHVSDGVRSRFTSLVSTRLQGYVDAKQID